MIQKPQISRSAKIKVRRIGITSGEERNKFRDKMSEGNLTSCTMSQQSTFLTVFTSLKAILEWERV